MTSTSLRKAAINSMKLSGQVCAGCTFTLPRPPSVNAAYRNLNGRGRVKTSAYTKWERAAGADMAMQRAGRLVPGRVAISYFVGRDTKADLGNFEKLLSDFLVSHFVIEDDSLVEQLHLEWADRPDVLVHVRQVEARAVAA